MARFGVGGGGCECVRVFSLYQRVHIYTPHTIYPHTDAHSNILIVPKLRKFHSSDYINTLLAVRFSGLKFVYDNREIRNSTKIPESWNNDTSHSSKMSRTMDRSPKGIQSLLVFHTLLRSVECIKFGLKDDCTVGNVSS